MGQMLQKPLESEKSYWLPLNMLYYHTVLKELSMGKHSWPQSESQVCNKSSF